MFVDFDKVFNQDPQGQVKIPDTLVSYLNSKLPHGVKYKVDNDGNCVLAHDGDSIIIGGLLFAPTEEQKEILGKNYSRQDVLDYSYNAQEPVMFSLKKDGYITVNGEEFPIDRLKYNPLHPIEYASGSFFAYPSPFNGEFDILVSGYDYERVLKVHQIPNKSVTVSVFESEKESSLYIRFSIDNRQKSIRMDISYNLGLAKSVFEIVEAASIYNAFIDGHGYLGNQHINSTLTDKTTIPYDETGLDFWKKVLAVEKALGVAFVPTNESIDFDTICLVEQLYQNLVNSVPIRSTDKIDTIDSVWKFKEEDKIREVIGKVVFFEFEATMNCELFGIKKTLPCLIKVFHSKVVDITQKGKKHKIKLEDESETVSRYTSTLCFVTEDSLKAYQNKNRNDSISSFHDAKRAREYL